jgi:hypothetical protein
MTTTPGQVSVTQTTEGNGDLTYAISGLTSEDLNLLVHALHTARQSIDKHLTKRKFRGVEDQMFLHEYSGRIATLQYRIFLDHSREIVEWLTTVADTDLDI